MSPRGSGETPHHCFRCPDVLWEAAKARAAKEGEPLSAVLTRALQEYINEEKP